MNEANIFAAASSIGIILNVTELAVLIREKKIKDPFKMVLFSLAIADFLTLAGASMIAFAYITNKTTVNYAFYAISPIAIISQFHIIIITLQRTIAVAFPMRYKALVTPRLCSFALVNVWILTPAISTVLLKFTSNFAINIFTFILFGSGAFLITSYSFIIHRVLSDRRKITASKVVSLQNKRLIIYSISVTLAFIACNYPFAIRILVLDGKNVEATDSSFASFLFFLNSIINPVLYLLLHTCQNRTNACCCLNVKSRGEGQRPVFHSSVNVEKSNGRTLENAKPDYQAAVCSYISSTI